MSTLHVGIDQRLQVVSAGIFRDKERKEFTRNEPGCRGVVSEDVYHVLIVKVAPVPQVCFDQVVMILRVVPGGQSFDVPACEGRCTLRNIALRVVTKPKRK